MGRVVVSNPFSMPWQLSTLASRLWRPLMKSALFPNAYHTFMSIILMRTGGRTHCTHAYTGERTSVVAFMSSSLPFKKIFGAIINIDRGNP